MDLVEYDKREASTQEATKWATRQMHMAEEERRSAEQRAREERRVADRPFATCVCDATRAPRVWRAFSLSLFAVFSPLSLAARRPFRSHLLSRQLQEQCAKTARLRRRLDEFEQQKPDAQQAALKATLVQQV